MDSLEQKIDTILNLEYQVRFAENNSKTISKIQDVAEK